MIGHNVEIGTNCLLCGHACIAGSECVGNNAVLAHPVMKKETTMDVFEGLRRLGRLYDDVAVLKKNVSNPKQSD